MDKLIAFFSVLGIFINGITVGHCLNFEGIKKIPLIFISTILAFIMVILLFRIIK